MMDRALNDETISDPCPLPQFEEINKSGNRKFFTKIDLRYHLLTTRHYERNQKVYFICDSRSVRIFSFAFWVERLLGKIPNYKNENNLKITSLKCRFCKEWDINGNFKKMKSEIVN